MNNSIFKGDDTRAFGNNFITIKIANKQRYQVLKIEVLTNNSACIPSKFYTDPDYFVRDEIELVVNYTSEETPKLNQGANVVNVRAYDMNGYPNTCSQSLTFYAKNGVICNNGKSCC